MVSFAGYITESSKEANFPGDERIVNKIGDQQMGLGVEMPSATCVHAFGGIRMYRCSFICAGTGNAYVDIMTYVHAHAHV